MKSQVLLTVWCNISGEAAAEIWNWSVLGVKGLRRSRTNATCYATVLDHVATRLAGLAKRTQHGGQTHATCCTNMLHATGQGFRLADHEEEPDIEIARTLLSKRIESDNVP